MAIVAASGHSKRASIQLVILRLKEDCPAIHPTLDYVLWHVWDEVAWLARHLFRAVRASYKLMNSGHYGLVDKLRFDPNFVRFDPNFVILCEFVERLQSWGWTCDMARPEPDEGAEVIDDTEALAPPIGEDGP